jgi:MFS family permease
MPYGLGVLLAGLLAVVAAYRGTPPGAYPVALLPALALVGVGAGLFTPAFFTLALAPLRTQEVGSAAGLLNAVQQLGATVGVAVLGSVYLSGADTGDPAASLRAAQTVCWVAVGLVGVTLAASGRMGTDAPAETEVSD